MIKRVKPKDEAGANDCLDFSLCLFFVLAGTLGVLRLPDFYTRLHAAGMTDTLGAELILLGLIIQSGFTQKPQLGKYRAPNIGGDNDGGAS